MSYKQQRTVHIGSLIKQQTLNIIYTKMMTIEEYRAAIYQILIDAKNEDGTPVLSEKEAREALNGFTDDELQDGILWNTPEDVAGIILEG